MNLLVTRGERGLEKSLRDGGQIHQHENTGSPRIARRQIKALINQKIQ